MTDTENTPVNNTARGREIARLTTPLVYKHGKAYDVNGDVVDCVETFSEFKHYLEPKKGILSEDEILKYARYSKAASQIRLDRGIGSFHDRLMLNQSLPWYLGMYYVVLACIAMPVIYYSHALAAFAMIILAIIPLIYALYTLKVKHYAYIPPENQIENRVEQIHHRQSDDVVPQGIASLKVYETKINNMMSLFDAKEKAVRELIEKRFEPPQMTYDRFISSVDACHKIFYTHAESALNIVHLAAEDTPSVKKELDSKIDSLKSLIDQIEDLTNELVININSDDDSNEDLKNVLLDMENLIDSVKDY